MTWNLDSSVNKLAASLNTLSDVAVPQVPLEMLVSQMESFRSS
jgi:hypothetical protein